MRQEYTTVGRLSRIVNVNTTTTPTVAVLLPLCWVLAADSPLKLVPVVVIPRPLFPRHGSPGVAQYGSSAPVLTPQYKNDAIVLIITFGSPVLCQGHEGGIHHSLQRCIAVVPYAVRHRGLHSSHQVKHGVCRIPGSLSLKFSRSKHEPVLNFSE